MTLDETTKTSYRKMSRNVFKGEGGPCKCLKLMAYVGVLCSAFFSEKHWNEEAEPEK